ncbi:MAG: T9SS type A sorting domain-containing protein [Cytophagales bacterium]|nr:T9SS type A sorting domain-containing protein [Cytophagales bacterium]
MKKTTFAFLILYLNVMWCYSQHFLWEKTYDFLIGASVSQGIEFSHSSGYILLASENGPGANGVIIFTNSLGDTLHTLRISTAFWANYRSPIKKVENGYVLAGTSYIQDTNRLQVIKLDRQGNIKWNNFYFSGRNETIPRDILISSPNEYLIFSEAANAWVSGNINGSRLCVHKVDSSGVSSLFKVYTDLPIVKDDRSVSIIKKKSGEYLLTANENLPGYITPFFSQINANLDTIITQRVLYTRDSYNYYYSQSGNAIYSSDNSFVFTGYFQSNSPSQKQAFVSKVDTNLNVLWTVLMQPTGIQSSRVVELSSGKILLVTPANAGNQLYLYTISSIGQKIDSTTLYNSVGNFRDVRQILLQPDNTLIYAGQANNKAYLAKIDLNGLVTSIPSTASDILKPNSYIRFYPNPAKETLNYESTTTGELLLQDASGKIVKDIRIRERKGNINITGLLSGAYTYRFTTRNFMENGKLVVE